MTDKLKAVADVNDKLKFEESNKKTSAEVLAVQEEVKKMIEES